MIHKFLTFQNESQNISKDDVLDSFQDLFDLIDGYDLSISSSSKKAFTISIIYKADSKTNYESFIKNNEIDNEIKKSIGRFSSIWNMSVHVFNKEKTSKGKMSIFIYFKSNDPTTLITSDVPKDVTFESIFEFLSPEFDDSILSGSAIVFALEKNNFWSCLYCSRIDVHNGVNNIKLSQCDHGGALLDSDIGIIRDISTGAIEDWADEIYQLNFDSEEPSSEELKSVYTNPIIVSTISPSPMISGTYKISKIVMKSDLKDLDIYQNLKFRDIIEYEHDDSLILICQICE